jgi:translation initiation factor IF-2
MAEDLEGTQKPKAELIKRAPNEYEASEGKGPVNASEHTEQRRKVVVLKKKPGGSPAVSGNAVPGAGTAVKKLQSKVVVTRNESQGTAAPGAAVKAGAAVGKSGSPSRKNDEPGESENAAGNNTAGQVSSESGAAPVNASPVMNGSSGARGPAKTETRRRIQGDQVSAYPFTQRPAAAAGRVGGRLVGKPPSREDGPRPGFQGRGAPTARTGGRPGPRPEGQGQRPFTQGGGGFRREGSGFGGPRPGGRPLPGGRPGPGGPRGPRGQTPPPASSLLEGKGPVKRTFKAKKPVYNRKEKELEMEEKLLQTKKKITQVTNPVPKTIDIMEVISVSELAKKMNLKASDLIQKLMSMGMMVTINQQIDAETASILAAEFGAEVKIISLYDETVIETGNDDNTELQARPPVVTIMGHVDHGKTKLLDAIRSADVASGEFGGITQHIGAYMVDTPNGRITFLDTPGHEAFTRMRARGAQVTDIVVLVVAADDGVMPQTIEAINHAKEAAVPIIVAVNKIDKPEANPDRVKSQLSELGLMPEDWGGQTMFVELSALQKRGIDKLIEAILLQAEILDLKANYTRSAEGKILESRIDHGRGIVATVLVERGTLGVGDSFVAGIWPGKVRALFNDKGEKLEKAFPSMPVEVLGFEGIPNAGDPLQVVDDEKTARGFSAKRQELKRFEDSKNVRKITLENLYDTISNGAIQELKVIIKADVQGSAEALRSSLEKLSNNEVRLNVIQALPGAINEGDVDLALASNAIIIGFNVRPVPKAKILADQEKVDIRKYNVIYKAVEEIQQAMEGMLKPDTKEEVIASVEVRNTFKVPKAGVIAGCYVLTGNVKRSASVNLIRDGIVIHTGKISSLRRFKDDVREVAAGFECGIALEDFDDIAVDDQFEVFEIVEVARKLS